MPLSEIDWNALALSAADLTGIVAFALAGILASVGRKLDPVGVYVMAFTTAFGGGIVRDVMIDNRPFYWLDKTGFMWVVLFMAIFAPASSGAFGNSFRTPSSFGLTPLVWAFSRPAAPRCRLMRAPPY